MYTYRFFLIITIFLLLFLALGCDDDKINNPPENFDSASLLGLVNGRTFTYLQTDTVITAEPYSIEEVTSNKVITVSGQGSDWIIADNDQPLINLKITQSSVIQNGYWREINAADSIFYFAAPPVIMKKDLNVSDPWSYYTPKYETDSSLQYLFFYYSYFGFSTVKEYTGIEEVITPSGAYNAYRFEVQLFANVFDVEPSATVKEYYYPNIGLVQLNLNTGPLKRSLNLIHYIDISR